MKATPLFYNWLLALAVCASACTSTEPNPPNPGNMDEVEPIVEETGDAIIDLSNWKVTLPIGRPTEVEPPEILTYQSNAVIQPYMYDDVEERAVVFYTKPGSTTQNSSYSRTELREQMVPGSNNTNWTFEQGGRLRGTLRLDEISEKPNGDFDRIIVMQIHGRLTNAQRDEIGEDDNNAPPVLKIYWNNGRIRVERKVLKDLNVAYPDILKKGAWTDESIWFSERVDKEKFTIEIIVKGTRMQVIMNDTEELVFDDIHTEKWNIFENYFKAGNYLISTDPSSFASVKYYDLEVSH